MMSVEHLTSFIFILLLSVIPLNAAEQKHRLRGRQKSNNSLPTNHCKLYWKFESTEERHQRTLDCEIVHEEKLYRLPLIGLTDEWLDLHKDEIISGESVLEAKNLRLAEDHVTVDVKSDWSFNWHTFLGNSQQQYQVVQVEHHEREKIDHNRRLVSRTKGRKRTVVVHIQAKDTSTPLNPRELSNHVFGTDGNDNNVRSQLKSCSYGQYEIVPSDAPGVVNGVYKMNLNVWARGSAHHVVQNAALDHLRGRFGSDLSATFDHVMICVPEGMRDFIAYAWGNDFLSVYHSDWCNSLTTKIHELGHNMGLQHSGEGRCEACDYADQSGLMGFVYPHSEGSKMCFNGAQSWQLGWYAPKSVTLNPLKYSWHGKLVGVDDYGRSRNQEQVILELDAPRQNIAYYVMFNRKSGINEGTKEAANKVLITSQLKQKGGLVGRTNLVAKLGAGDRYVIKNFNRSGEQVCIRVDQILKRVASPWTVHVAVDSSIAPLRTPAPTPSPSSSQVVAKIDTAKRKQRPEHSHLLFDVSAIQVDCDKLGRNECSKHERYCTWDQNNVCRGRVHRSRHGSRKKARSGIGNPRHSINSYSWDFSGDE